MSKKTISIKLKRSTIAATPKQKATIIGLGLRKTGTSKVLVNTSAVRGMIKKVIHLLEVSE
jgi:large subunit ribosomal protein L30